MARCASLPPLVTGQLAGAHLLQLMLRIATVQLRVWQQTDVHGLPRDITVVESTE